MSSLIWKWPNWFASKYCIGVSIFFEILNLCHIWHLVIILIFFHIEVALTYYLMKILDYICWECVFALSIQIPERELNTYNKFILNLLYTMLSYLFFNFYSLRCLCYDITIIIEELLIILYIVSNEDLFPQWKLNSMLNHTRQLYTWNYHTVHTYDRCILEPFPQRLTM